MSALKTSLPEALAAAVKATVANWQSGGKIERLWQRDATLWTGSDESNWLGWLDIVDEQVAQQEQLQKSPKKCSSAASSTCSCSAWAGRAFVRKFCA